MSTDRHILSSVCPGVSCRSIKAGQAQVKLLLLNAVALFAMHERSTSTSPCELRLNLLMPTDKSRWESRSELHRPVYTIDTRLGMTVTSRRRRGRLDSPNFSYAPLHTLSQNSRSHSLYSNDASKKGKGKRSPCSITERTVPEMIPVLGSQPEVTWVINPAVGCHYFSPGPQLPSRPLRGLLPILLFGEQRRDGCEQFA